MHWLDSNSIIDDDSIDSEFPQTIDFKIRKCKQENSVIPTCTLPRLELALGRWGVLDGRFRGAIKKTGIRSTQFMQPWTRA